MGAFIIFWVVLPASIIILAGGHGPELFLRVLAGGASYSLVKALINSRSKPIKWVPADSAAARLICVAAVIGGFVTPVVFAVCGVGAVLMHGFHPK